MRPMTPSSMRSNCMSSPRSSSATGAPDKSNRRIPASKGLARKGRSPSRCAQDNTTSPALAHHRSCRLRASAARLSARAAETPARRCNSAGSSGLARGGGGQAPSFNPITHSPSTGPARASARLHISTRATVRRAAAKAWSRHWRCNWRKASPASTRPSTASSISKPSRASRHASPAAASTGNWARCPGQPSAASIPPNAAPHADGN